MSYTQQTWFDGPLATTPTPLSSTRLNHMEAGIENATVVAEAAIPGAEKGVTVATLDPVTHVLPDSQIPSGITRDSELATSLAALVAAAPGFLDTLNELAQAIGDDPNFATTITNLLATKSTPAQAAGIAMALGA